jgi:hypothetical protein
MKKTSIFILIICLFGLVGNLSATSPMPEESKPGQTENFCMVHVAHSVDSEKGILREEASSTLTFEASTSKKDVLERLTQYLNKKLNEDNISEFKVECKFPKR